MVAEVVMAISYDERVIVEFAERLYRRAANIVISYVVIVGGLGALVAAIGSSWSSSRGGNAPGINGGAVATTARHATPSSRRCTSGVTEDMAWVRVLVARLERARSKTRSTRRSARSKPPRTPNAPPTRTAAS